MNALGMPKNISQSDRHDLGGASTENEYGLEDTRNNWAGSKTSLHLAGQPSTQTRHDDQSATCTASISHGLHSCLLVGDVA